MSPADAIAWRGRVRAAGTRRRQAVAAGAAALLLAGVVLAATFPRVVKLAASRLDLARAPTLDPLGAVLLPHRLAAAGAVHAAWRLVGVLLLAAGAAAAGSALKRRVGLVVRGGRAEPLFSTALGLASVVYAVLLLALIGVARRPVLLALLVGLGAWGAVATARALRRRRWRLAAALRARTYGGRTGVVAAGVIGLFLLVAFVGALGPEVEFDALWYHLYFPRLLLHSGTLVDVRSEYVSLYPQTAELLYALGLAWDGTVAAKLVAFLLGVLTVGATYALARVYLGRSLALVAAAAFLAAPTPLWEFTTAYNDLAAAFFLTMALLDVALWRRDRVGRRLLRSSLLLGCALATKDSALLALPPLALLVAAGLAGPVSGRLRPRALPSLRPLLLSGAYAGGALLVAAPWYVRSALASGDPLFPQLFGVLGAPPDRWTDVSARGLHAFLEHFGLGRDPSALLLLPWNLVRYSDRFDGSFGPLLAIAVPLALLSTRRRLRRLAPVAIFAFGYIVLWATPLSSFQLRFLVPVAPALAVLGAAGLAALAGRLRVGGLRVAAAAVPLAALVLLLLDLPPLMPLQGRGYLPGGGGWINSTLREVDVASALDPVAADARLRRLVRGYRAVEWANAHVPPDARVLDFVGGLNYYFVSPTLIYTAPTARPATAAPRGAGLEALSVLRRLGVAYVLFDTRSPEFRDGSLALTSPAFRRTRLRLLYEDAGTALYAVRPR